MADFHKHTATDDFEVITAAGTFLLGASLVDATNDLYVAKVGGTGADFATDIGLALAAFEASVARQAVIFIGSAAADFTTPVTVTKGNVTFMGVIPTAGFTLSAAAGVIFDLPDTDQPTVKFLNLDFTRTPGDGRFVFNQSVTLILDDCVIACNDGDGTGLFSVVATMRAAARDCVFSAEGTAADASIIFTGTTMQLRLDHCIFVEPVSVLNPARFLSSSGAVELTLTNHTIILEPRLQSVSYSVIYDGTSLMTNNGNNTGTETVHGEAGYSTEVDGVSLSTPIATPTVGIADALRFFVGDALFITPGSYFTSIAIVFGNNLKTIRGAGYTLTSIVLQSGGAIAFSVTGDFNIIKDLNFSTDTLVPTTVVSVSGDNNRLVDVRFLQPPAGDFSSSTVLLLSGDRNRAIRCIFDPNNRTVSKLANVTGSYNVLDACEIDPLGIVTITDGFDSTGVGTTIRNCHIKGSVSGTTFTRGIRSTGNESVIHGSYLYSGGVVTYTTGISLSGAKVSVQDNWVKENAGTGTDGILLATLTDSQVNNNYVDGFTDGIDSDGTCADNQYNSNFLRGNTTPLNQDAGDTSEANLNKVT